MSNEISLRVLSITSGGSGDKKRRYHQSHLNETDGRTFQTGVGSDSTASQKDRVIRTVRRKQVDKGYGIKDYVFGTGGNFQFCEDPQVDLNLKNRRPDMMAVMTCLPQTKLSKRANEEGEQDENKENINAADNTESPQQKYNRKEDRSVQNLNGDNTRAPLQELQLTDPRLNADKNTDQSTAYDDFFHSMARVSYKLRLESQIEHRRQLYLASIEANKALAKQKNSPGN